MTLLVLLLPLVLVVVLTGALVLVVVALQRRGAAVPATVGPTLPDRIDRHQRLMRALSVVAGATVLLALPLALPSLTLVSVGPSDGATGVVPALLPLAVAILVVGVLLLGERAWPRPAGEVRTAPLTHRTLGSTSPTWLRRLTLGWAAALLVLLVTCGIVGDGTTVTAVSSDADSAVASSSGPFPGWPYGLPTLAVAAGLLALTWVALTTIRRRPAVVTLTATADEELRRHSSARVLRVTQAALGLTLAGNAFFAGTAIGSVGSGWPEMGVAAPWWGTLGPWLAGVGVLVAFAAVLALLPLPRRGADAGAPR